MAVHFHRLKLKEVRKETPDCVSLLFTIPPELEEEFRFEQGQNITIRKIINGEELRRSYSICSAPYEKELRVAVKKVSGGRFSTLANEGLKEGDELELLPPTGRFYSKLHSANSKKYIAFVAGSGITPVISIIKTTLQTEPNSSFTLVFGNRSRSSIIFFEELANLKNKYLQRFNLINILSREKMDTPLNSGRIDKEKLTELMKMIKFGDMDEFFICGPEEMIFCIKDFLEKAGIENKKIHIELFTTPGERKAPGLKPVSANTSGSKTRITVKLDGRSFDFDLPINSDISILDAALQQGADLPYACKGGVCCTCKARLLEGEVEMEVNWGLEQEEVEQGYILTCQSHPKTERIVVDFDVK